MVGTVRVPSGLVADLGASLATFQLGESGTGEHLLSAARGARCDADYIHALALFVAEEQQHASLLALVLDELGVPLRTRHWSDAVFVAVRRLHSLRTEILVLLVAEVIALTYYAALRDGIGEPTLAGVFDRIRDDEIVHVEFHCQTLPAHLGRLPRPARAVARLGWNLLVRVASGVVALDHGRVLRAMGLSRRSFLRRVSADRRVVDARLFAALRSREDGMQVSSEAPVRR